MLITALIWTSCSTLSTVPTAQSTSTEYIAGNGFGTSLAALYSQYKSSGKINLANTSTLFNLTSLATNGAAIKGLGTNTTNYKNFASGVVSGSTNLVTTGSVDKIISSVNNLNLQSVVNAVSNNTITPQTTTAVTSSLITIFGLLGK